MQNVLSEKWTCEHCGEKENDENYCIQCGRSHHAQAPYDSNDKGSERRKVNNEHTATGDNKNNTNILIGCILGVIGIFSSTHYYSTPKLANETVKPISKQTMTKNEYNNRYNGQNTYNNNNQNSKNNYVNLKEKNENNVEANESERSMDKPWETGKTIAQRDAMKVLYDFHDNITHKKLRQAYDCLSPDFQRHMTYEGWAPGFNTTVSSTPSDVKVISESDSLIVMTYNLQAVDNPGGTQNFNGTVTVAKTVGGWKIDDIVNKKR